MSFLTRPGTLGTVAFLGPERVQPCDHGFGVVRAGEIVEVVPHELVQAGSPQGGDPSGLGDYPVVEGQCDVHEHRLGMDGVRVN